MPLRVDNVRQASIGTIAKMNDTLRNASHASAFTTYRRMKSMEGAWKESKELDVRAQAFQLISIFNWKRAGASRGRTGRAGHGRSDRAFRDRAFGTEASRHRHRLPAHPLALPQPEATNASSSVSVIRLMRRVGARCVSSLS